MCSPGRVCAPHNSRGRHSHCGLATVMQGRVSEIAASLLPSSRSCQQIPQGQVLQSQLLCPTSLSDPILLPPGSPQKWDLIEKPMLSKHNFPHQKKGSHIKTVGPGPCRVYKEHALVVKRGGGGTKTGRQVGSPQLGVKPVKHLLVSTGLAAGSRWMKRRGKTLLFVSPRWSD